MIQRINSKHSHQLELDRTNEDILQLGRRLQQVKQFSKEDIDHQCSQKSDRVLDREWYMWLQNNLGSMESLDSQKLLPLYQEHQ